jgi:3-deoxy-D-manno-octulosonate 8-phosphate phosphatase (KDO 8-P phosphatase)
MKRKTIMEDIIERAGKIKLLLTDCDGVLTDARVYYSASGEAMKQFSMRDGMGVERLRKLVAVDTGIITGENSEIVHRRAEKLGITEYYPGSNDKYHTLKEIMRKKSLQADEIAFIGDDCNDLEILKHVGLSACPADAFSEVRETVHLTLENAGGQDVFREFAEILIKIKQKQI